MKFEVVEPNPDGLDEVFDAYQTIRTVLKHATLVRNAGHEWEEEAAQAAVEESLDMLGAWLIQESKKRAGWE